MKTATRLPLALLILLTTLAAQDAPEDKTLPMASREDLAVDYYRVGSGISAHTLLPAVQAVWGREFKVNDTRRTVHNLFVVGNAIGVVDTPDRAQAILEELPRMEEAASEREAPSQTPRKTVYVPLSNVSAPGVLKVLAPYRRSFGGVANIVAHQETNGLVIRDTQEAIDEIRALVSEIDTAASEEQRPPITLTCHVLQASDEEQEEAGLPEELVANLRRLVPWSHFKNFGTGILRAMADSRNVETRIDLSGSHHCTLDLRNLRYRPEAKTLELGRLSFVHEDGMKSPTVQSLETSTEVTLGEYTVIGALGTDPYFVFLVISADIVR